MVTLSINQALRGAPSSIKSHISLFGSAGIRYSWRWADAVVAEVTSTDEIASLVYNTHMAAPLAAQASSTQSFLDEGMWWKRESGVVPYLFLTNVTSAEAIAHVAVSGRAGDAAVAQDIALPAHGSQFASLAPMIASLENAASAGGVTVTYSGVGRPIVVEGALENTTKGYSLTFPVIPMSARSARNLVMSGAVQYAAVGLQYGSPDPSMNFPEGTTFVPYATLRNLSANSIAITPTLSLAQGASLQVLTSITLAPRETRQLDLSAAASAMSPEVGAELNLLFSYQGSAGDVLLATGSTAKDGSYVFAVDPQLTNKVRGDVQSLWQVQGSTDTMVSFWNTGKLPEDDVLELDYGVGTYVIPMHFGANASKSLDIGALLNRGVPDVNGAVVPAVVTAGLVRLRPHRPLGPKWTPECISRSLTRLQLPARSPAPFAQALSMSSKHRLLARSQRQLLFHTPPQVPTMVETLKTSLAVPRGLAITPALRRSATARRLEWLPVSRLGAPTSKRTLKTLVTFLTLPEACASTRHHRVRR